MNILVLNVGSSSIKYRLYKDNSLRTKGLIENIKNEEGYRKGIDNIISLIEKKRFNVEAIGHRVVHGDDLKESAVIDDRVLKIINDCCEFAPLHNTPQLKVINICKEKFPGIKQVAVFDTSFHNTMPKKAAMYGIAKKYFLQGVKRQGFHGTSHMFVSQGIKGRVITCHLGNGCSISAVKDGKSVDTSMGFTPLEGLIMGTRCGDIDAGAVLYIMEKENLDVDQMNSLLNKKSGLLGLSGVSNDLRELIKSKNADAKEAIEVFVYKIIKYIGSYIAVLGGLDTLVFTAGIGENSSLIRKKVCDHFGFIGLKIAPEKNIKNEKVISSKDSKVSVMVVQTDEELMIAKETERLLA